eukprot:scaffold14417_cov461-Ochromonas_danica.AAC.1
MAIGSYYMPKQSLYYNRNPPTALNINYYNAESKTGFKKLEQKLDVSKYCMAKRHAREENKPFPLPMKSQLLENGDVGKRLMADLQESWEVYHTLPVFELSCEDGELKVMLTGHLSAVSTSRQTLEAHILQALNNDKSYQLLPCERAGHQVRHLANLRPLATSYDLLSIVLNPDLCLHFNPFLSEKAIEKVKCMIVTWLQLCTLEDKVQRMLSYVESNQRVKLVQEFQT